MCADRADATPRLGVALCWHMHQPEYRDLRSGEWQQPWTYLHAIKDYVDMAAHLEACERARATVNFAPVLLEQIEASAAAASAALEADTPPRDALLSALLNVPQEETERLALLRACLRANEQRVIARFPTYRLLADMGRRVVEAQMPLSWLGDGYFRDLVIWYHLAWLGETVRRTDLRVRALEQRSREFDSSHARELLALIAELLGGLLGRYRALAESGRVELSFSPWGHPIVPLLLDFGSARDAMPGVALPAAGDYPGGAERARWHLREGMDVFERHFGHRPRGCWLSEGGVSDAALGLLDECGLRWTASGESVLGNSVARARGAGAPLAEPMAHRPITVDGRAVRCFFRSDHLSDLIGFNYAEWHADDAVANLVEELEKLADGLPNPAAHTVSVIMDGENAWEHYPDNGYWFLSALYRNLCNHPRLVMRTLTDAAGVSAAPPAELPSLVAGSWVYGTFSTWIGDGDKNRAWDLLISARVAFLAVEKEQRLEPAQLELARRRLAVCEASDWFWWFGDYNPAESVRDFDRLYRQHLAALYEALELALPSALSEPLSVGNVLAGMEHGGVMRRGGSE